MVEVIAFGYGKSFISLIFLQLESNIRYWYVRSGRVFVCSGHISDFV